MSDREIYLKRLVVGDIFHATSTAMPSLICLITNISDTIIGVRVVTTQIELQLNRKTGVAVWGDKHVVGKIDSVTPLPVDIHNVFIG